jgi:hypothetical protein
MVLARSLPRSFALILPFWPRVGIDLSSMLGMVTGRFPFALSGARSRLGLSRLPACPRALFVSPCGLLVGFEVTQLRLFAVLAGDLVAVV